MFIKCHKLSLSLCDAVIVSLLKTNYCQIFNVLAYLRGHRCKLTSWLTDCNCCMENRLDCCRTHTQPSEEVKRANAKWLCPRRARAWSRVEKSEIWLWKICSSIKLLVMICSCTLSFDFAAIYQNQQLSQSTEEKQQRQLAKTHRIR